MILTKENRLRCLISLLVFIALQVFIGTQPELIVKIFGYDNVIKYIDFVFLWWTIYILYYCFPENTLEQPKGF